MSGRIAARLQDRANGARNRRRIAVPTAASIDGTGVEARTAANAAEGFAKSRAAEKLTSTIVDDHDVEFLRRAWARPTEMRGVGRNGLSGRRAREQPQEGREVFLLRNDLLETNARDVKAWKRRSKIGIAFVRDDDEASGFGDGEVDAGESGFGFQKTISKVSARDVGQLSRIIEVRCASHFLRKKFADFRSLQMNGWHHDMAGGFAPKLHDSLAEIRVDDFDTLGFEVGIESAFLGEHRLALHDMANATVPQKAGDDFVVLVRISRPMNDGSGGGRVLFEFTPEFWKFGECGSLDRAGLIAQSLPVRHEIGGLVALAANEPERLVVPARAIDVGYEFPCALTMSHGARHSPVA